MTHQRTAPMPSSLNRESRTPCCMAAPHGRNANRLGAKLVNVPAAARLDPGHLFWPGHTHLRPTFALATRGLRPTRAVVIRRSTGTIFHEERIRVEADGRA